MKYLLPWASALHFDVLTCLPFKYVCFLSYFGFCAQPLVLLFALTREKRIVLLLTSTARPTMFDPYV